MGCHDFYILYKSEVLSSKAAVRSPELLTLTKKKVIKVIMI